MEKYSIIFTKSSVRELEGIGRKDAQRILRRIFELAENPRPVGCEKLSGRFIEFGRVIIELCFF